MLYFVEMLNVLKFMKMSMFAWQILRVLGENAIAVRTKAMKCLSEVVAVDPSILARVKRSSYDSLFELSIQIKILALRINYIFLFCFVFL